MTKAKISEYDAVASNNTDVNGVNIAEGCPPSGMNNMGREIMAALKRFQVGSDGDGVTVGGNLVVSGSSTLSTTSISSADINAGTIDGTAIGGSTPAAGSFTTLNTSGAVVFNDAGADVDFRVEGDTDANLLFVDASADVVLIGTNTTTNNLRLNEKLAVVNVGTFGGASLTGYNGASALPVVLDFNKSRGSSDGSMTVVANADELGAIVFRGADGTQFQDAAVIACQVDGTPGAGDMPGRLVFKITPDGSPTPVERMRIDSSGRLGLGTSSPTYSAEFQNQVSNDVLVRIRNTISLEDTGLIIDGNNGGQREYRIGINTIANSPDLTFSGPTGYQWYVNGSERMRIDSSGNLLVGKTVTALGTAGARILSNGEATFTVSGDAGLQVNRLTDDGNLVLFYQASTLEGSISVSGNTVSYNPFLGSHAGALADWSRPDIKIGTVMDTIDELLEYKVVVINVQEEVPAKDAVLDEEGNEVEPAQEATTQTVQKRISYNGNGAVGSTATVEYEGQEYIGTIQHEREEPLSFNKHLKVKINDTAASKTVFGVFVGWNNDSTNDGGVYNDMLVGAVGNYVIRMAAGQTPEAGDLVEADGNGCAVVQDDDIIRTKTVAKVTSTIKQVTYDDGSFLVTCVLYCG